LGLRVKLDLADAATAGLDVVPRDRYPIAAAMRVDLAFDRVDVLDRGEVEVLAPNERLQLAQETSPGGAVPSRGARLDQRRALPVLPDALVVGERCRDRHREGRRGGIGAKPQIGTERIAVAGVGFENSDQLARQTDEKRLWAVACGYRRHRGVVEEDQI